MSEWNGVYKAKHCHCDSQNLAHFSLLLIFTARRDAAYSKILIFISSFNIHCEKEWSFFCKQKQVFACCRLVSFLRNYMYFNSKNQIYIRINHKKQNNKYKRKILVIKYYEQKNLKRNYTSIIGTRYFISDFIY